MYDVLSKKRRIRDNKRKDRPSKNFVHTRTPHNVMTRENLLTKLDQQRVEMKSLNSELSKLRRKCEQEIDTKGVQLQDFESSEMKDFMAVCREDVERSFPDENCFQRPFLGPTVQVHQFWKKWNALASYDHQVVFVYTK